MAFDHRDGDADHTVGGKDRNSQIKISKPLGHYIPMLRLLTMINNCRFGWDKNSVLSQKVFQSMCKSVNEYVDDFLFGLK